MKRLYIIVRADDPETLTRVRRAAARPWLQPQRGDVRYWVPSLQDAEREQAMLFLAGFASEIEGRDPVA